MQVIESISVLERYRIGKAHLVYLVVVAWLLLFLADFGRHSTIVALVVSGGFALVTGLLAYGVMRLPWLLFPSLDRATVTGDSETARIVVQWRPYSPAVILLEDCEWRLVPPPRQIPGQLEDKHRQVILLTGQLSGRIFSRTTNLYLGRDGEKQAQWLSLLEACKVRKAGSDTP